MSKTLISLECNEAVNRNHLLRVRKFDCAMTGRHPHTPKLTFPVLPRAHDIFGCLLLPYSPLWRALAVCLLASSPSWWRFKTLAYFRYYCHSVLYKSPGWETTSNRLGWRNEGMEGSGKWEEARLCQCWQEEASDEWQPKTWANQSHTLRRRA